MLVIVCLFQTYGVDSKVRDAERGITARLHKLFQVMLLVVLLYLLHCFVYLQRALKKFKVGLNMLIVSCMCCV